MNSILFLITFFAVPPQIEMIEIPAGTFTMGSDQRAVDERPSHKIYLDAYAISKFEITNSEYYQFWKAIGDHTPADFSDGFGFGKWEDRALKNPDHPVIGISWKDATAFAKWAGGRLPTEAEWEKAARGTSDRIWAWGSSPKPFANTWNNDRKTDQNGLEKVGSYPDGSSFYGAMDMIGNVWEWTADWFSDNYYAISPSKNPIGPKVGSWRVIRGGSWIDDLKRCTVTFRMHAYPSTQTTFIGFRIVKSIKSEREKN